METPRSNPEESPPHLEEPVPVSTSMEHVMAELWEGGRLSGAFDQLLDEQKDLWQRYWHSNRGGQPFSREDEERLDRINAVILDIQALMGDYPEE